MRASQRGRGGPAFRRPIIQTAGPYADGAEQAPVNDTCACLIHTCYSRPGARARRAPVTHTQAHDTHLFPIPSFPARVAVGLDRTRTSYLLTQVEGALGGSLGRRSTTALEYRTQRLLRAALAVISSRYAFPVPHPRVSTCIPLRRTRRRPPAPCAAAWRARRRRPPPACGSRPACLPHRRPHAACRAWRGPSRRRRWR